MTIDEVGAVTPEAARVRWNGYPLEIDIEHPDRVSGFDGLLAPADEARVIWP